MISFYETLEEESFLSHDSRQATICLMSSVEMPGTEDRSSVVMGDSK
jgi:hypothetical protein